MLDNLQKLVVVVVIVVLLVVQLASIVLSITLHLLSIVKVHALGLTELVRLGPGKASQNVLGRLVVFGYACPSWSVNGSSHNES